MKELSLALFIACASGLCWAITTDLAVSNGGGFSFASNSGSHFEPVLFDASWGRCRAFGGWSDENGDADGPWTRAFEIVGKDAAPVVRGKVTYVLRRDASAGEPVAHFTWEFSAAKDFEGKEFCLAWTLPCEQYASDASAGKVVFGGKMVELPQKYSVTHLGNATCDMLEIAAPAGAPLRIKLERPTWCMVQDDRQWNNPCFSLRMAIGDGRLKAGERRTFSMTMRGISSFVRDGKYTVRASDDWVPVNDTTAVKAGSALDFSAAGWIDAPAGKHGRVVRKGDHFEFAGMPGVKQRFYGVNLCFSANYMSAADAEELATRLSRLGYNALRIHHYERELCDRKDGTTIRPEKMSELDNLLNACIRHGIYLTTDLFVSRNVPWRSCGIDRDGVVQMKEYKELVLFHDGAFRNYLDFSRQLLNHVNPETGRRWADEPAFAFLALINEGNPGNHGYGFMKNLPEAKTAWEKWLAAHKTKEPETYAKITDKVPDNCWENSPQNCAYALFLTDIEIDFAKRMTAFIRDEIRSQVLLTDLSCWKNAIEYQLVRTCYDYVDDHFYVDHPKFLEKDWQLPSSCPNSNPVRGANAGFEAVARHRLLDRPFTLTEFNYSGPGQFRGVGGMMLGAQAALQEYDGIWRFAWSHNAEGLLKPQSIHYFDVAKDPLQRATERAVTMLYLRGDMKPLKRTHAVVFPEKALRSDFSCGPQADIKDMWFGWHARFGTLIADALPPGATSGGLFPEIYSRTSDDYRRWAEGSRPGDGQVIIDREKGLFGVDTPRTAGFFAEAGERTVGPLTAKLDGKVPAAVWVSALDDAPIASSRRLLLTHVADVQDEGTVYADGTKKVLLKWGRLPHLMRRSAAEVTVVFEDAKPCTVYALSSDGSRRGEVPVIQNGGKVSFVANTARDPAEATCYYEIIRIWYN
ncbi:MAG: hypothetical protein J6Q49_04065 [Kiritimatiellae bacterium]|nr:hypothetical protein [Kiritimatiellia bacterium]